MLKLPQSRPVLSRPLVLMALFCLGGLTLCCLGLSVWVCFGILAGCALILAAATRKSLLPLALALIIACLMTARFSSAVTKADAIGEKYDGMETLIAGRIRAAQTYTDNICSTVLDTELGLIELTSYTGNIGGEIGDKVTVTAELARPAFPKNDYGFDSREYLLGRGIVLTAEAKDAPRTSPASRRGILWLASKIRAHALAMGERYLDGEALELYSAIVFGDRSRLDPKLKTSLSIAGLSHISAVSGTHLSVVTMIIMFLLSLAFGRRRFARLLTIPVMALFTLVTGCEPSVVRAFIMGTIFQLSAVLYRENDSLSALSLAFMLMCGVKPLIFFSAGFRMSIAATLGIVLFAGPLQRPVKYLAGLDVFKGSPPLRVLSKIIAAIGAIAAVSLSAQTAVFPLSIYYFNYISSYALLSNLLTAPLLTPVMAAGLLLAVIGSVPLIGGVPALVCGPLLDFIALIAKTVAALPGAAIPAARPGLPLIAAYISLVFALYFFAKNRRIAAASLAAVFTVFAVISGISAHKERNTEELCFINSGRGDCALFKLKDGMNVLVDGGNNSAPMDYLTARGIFRLDCAVLTSAKSERIIGLINLVDGGFVKTIYVPDCITNHDSLDTLLLSAAEAGTEVTYYSPGGSIYAGGLILNAIDTDGESVQLLAEYNGKKALLCGDSVMDWTDCDIVKMPSHGAGGYNYYPELHRHKPEYAVMTASGAYYAEKSKSAAVLKDMGIPCYVPALDGTVTFALGEELSVTTTREKLER